MDFGTSRSCTGRSSVNSRSHAFIAVPSRTPMRGSGSEMTNTSPSSQCIAALTFKPHLHLDSRYQFGAAKRRAEVHRTVSSPPSLASHQGSAYRQQSSFILQWSVHSPLPSDWTFGTSDNPLSADTKTPRLNLISEFRGGFVISPLHWPKAHMHIRIAVSPPHLHSV
ncbi:hypothetical protein GALMADRAFT_631342 [Galerina marginata CBS 339.88]|uniref:Uncharacterized protein n=1 Tax=Galerina marginata (strain CBS 339.88) TaxID=685588 RepID=A0A067T3Z5_GALM3|nr:hypothetical protein GALMADRAFT_631342 [Galerina marginata CBS 339.88]